MLLTLLKELQKKNQNRKRLIKERKAKNSFLNEMSFNRDIGFRYFGFRSSPFQRNISEQFRQKSSQRKLYRSQSELTLRNIENNENFKNNHADEQSHRSVPSSNILKNCTLLHSHNSSSFNEDESDDLQYEPQKTYKNKKKSKKHKRSIVSASSSWDNNNNSSSNNTTDKDYSSIKEEKDDVPNNWMSLFLPSYKSRLSKFQRTFEEIPPNEKLVDDYNCALRKDILLQGRLYISVNYIAFYSNILGYETILTLKFSDITSISKATTMKVFHNAIEIHTNTDEKHILTSFVSRERAFTLMFKLWKNSSNLNDIDSTAKKITWQEICKYIRNSYITDTLPRDLSELDHLDLQQHILKGKSVTKKLQYKKERLKLLEIENSHQRSDSIASFLSAFEDLPEDGELANTSNRYLNSDNQTVILDISNNKKDNLSYVWSKHIYKIIPSNFGKSFENYVQYCANERHIVLICVIVSLALLIVQISLFCWVTLFEKKINHYEKLLIDTLEAKHLQFQQHSILTDSG